MLHAERDLSSTSIPLISPDVLIGGQQISFICRIPSPAYILHTLGYRCVLSDRQVHQHNPLTRG